MDSRIPVIRKYNNNRDIFFSQGGKRNQLTTLEVYRIKH